MTRRTHTRLSAMALLPGLIYFALVFALGFVLGIGRALFLQAVPSAGRLTGVLIEVPIMLGASWILCRDLVRRFAVVSTVVARAVMGGLAFALLLLAELLIGALLFGRGPAEHVALYAEASYALGFLAQIGFGLMPLIQIRWVEKP
ncbi:hypothetical protein ACHAW5_004446 [Stephanodiscus triporus]|uniref:Uncharacterized protein n=1 Tax=Stephanodiscus triporus TaxID=2934178 RepID=A0ABD3QI72_9STRA